MKFIFCKVQMSKKLKINYNKKYRIIEEQYIKQLVNLKVKYI